MDEHARGGAAQTGRSHAAHGSVQGFLARQQFGTRLALGFGGLLALVALTAVVAAWGVLRVREQVGGGLADAVKAEKAANLASLGLAGARLQERAFLLRWHDDGHAAAAREHLGKDLGFPPAGDGRDRWSKTRVQDSASALLSQFSGALGVLRAVARDEVGDAAALLAGPPPLKGTPERERWCLALIGKQLAPLEKDEKRYRAALRNLAARLAERGHELRPATGEVVRLGQVGALYAAGREIEAAAGLPEVPTGTAAVAAAGALPPVQASGPAPSAGLQAAALALRGATRDYLLHAGQEQREPPAEDEDAPERPDLCEGGGDRSPRPAPGERAAARVLARLAALETGGAASGQAMQGPAAAFRRAFEALRRVDEALHHLRHDAACTALRMEDGLAEIREQTTAIIEHRQAAADDAARDTVGFVLLFALLLLVAGALLASRIAGEIRVPVQNLVEAAEEVAHGNLQAEALVYADDEIGRLATTFNSMTRQLAAQKARIEEQMREIVMERDRSEKLLLNILPAPIADRLKQKEHPIADAFEEATVLFADVVGYTRLSSRIPAREVVERLSEIFTAFDAIAARHGVEKIKTIGDAYMAACGLPGRVVDHAARVARMALDMRVALARINEDLPEVLELRIGLNTGPVVAGVIGDQKFIYDMWGDAVNVASRMESHGEAGRIHVTASVRDHLGDDFELVARGEVEIKGKGKMETFWLVAEKGVVR